MWPSSSSLHFSVNGASHFVTWKKFWRATTGIVVVVPKVTFFFGFSSFSTEHWSDVVEHEALTK